MCSRSLVRAIEPSESSLEFDLRKPVKNPKIMSRKLVLVGMLMLAFLLPFLTWREAAGGGLLVLLFNALIFPQIESASLEPSRPKEAFAPFDGRAEMISYAVSILVLILIFRRHMEVVAAAWAFLALGDGAAGVCGRAAGGPALTWNRRKTWAGFAAFISAGTLGAYVLMRWVSPHIPADKAFAVSLAGAALAAIVETIPIGLDDNLTVPLVSGGFIFCLLLVQQSALASNRPYLAVRIALAVAVSAVFSLLALTVRAVNRSGAVAGFLLGIALYMGYGWKSFSIAALFFILGAAATRLGYSKKAGRGVAEIRGGARSWREALANTLAGAFFSILVITTHHEAAFLAALVASFAEAAGDTVSSEIGQWLSPQTYLISSWKPVEPGKNGGVSFAGSLAGLAACTVVVAAGWDLKLCMTGAAVIALSAAIAGNVLDSLLGATLEERHLLINGAVNFAGTAFAGALALALMFHFHLG